jgi:hypothetical protein
MKISTQAVLLGLTLAASATLAQAQVIYRDSLVKGTVYGTQVVTRFQMWINADNNTVVIDVDNAIPRPTTPPLGTVFGKGTLISFGFNLPSSLGVNDNGDVAMRAKLTSSTSRTMWRDLSGTSSDVALNQWSSNIWEEHTPWDIHLPAPYDQDYGVSVPGGGIGGPLDYGIRYGEKATFEFTFSNFNSAAFAGFMDRTNDLTAYWEGVESKTYETRSGVTKWYTNDRPSYDKGVADFRLPSDGDLPATPEPSTYGLMGAAALLGLVAHRRMKSKKATA